MVRSYKGGIMNTYVFFHHVIIEGKKKDLFHCIVAETGQEARDEFIGDNKIFNIKVGKFWFEKVPDIDELIKSKKDPMLIKERTKEEVLK